MTMKNNLTFSWSNYLKPTPSNVQYFALSIKGILAGVAGTAIWQEASKEWSLGMVIAILLVDEIAKFAGKVSAEIREEVVVSYPKEVADKVDVEIKDK